MTQNEERIPVVSVVMPCYNAEKYLRQAIESILDQTFHGFELILIDDCSTDRTREIIDHYQRKDGRVRCLINDVNLGVAKSLNRGLEAVRGKYVARMDADDIAAHDRLSKQLRLMESDSSVVVCGSDVALIDEEGRNIGRRAYLHPDAELKKQLYIKNPFAHPSVMMRKDLLAKHALRYDDRYARAEDYHLWFMLAPHGSFRNIAEPLLRYRVSTQAIKTVHCKAMILDTIALKLHYLGQRKKMLFRPGVLIRLALEVALLALPAAIIIRLFYLVDIRRPSREGDRKTC